MLTLCEVQWSLRAPWLTCKADWFAHPACARQTFSVKCWQRRSTDALPLAGYSHHKSVTPCDLLDERPWGARLPLLLPLLLLPC